MLIQGPEVKQPKGLEKLDIYEGEDLPEGGFYVICADKDNRAQSLVRMHPDPKDSETYVVTNLKTREELRGRGLGSAVLYAAEKTAVTAGARRFVLYAEIENALFYIKRGYLPDGKGIQEGDNVYPKLVKQVK